MADTTFDPRFDPAFQRGFAAGERGERADDSEARRPQTVAGPAGPTAAEAADAASRPDAFTPPAAALPATMPGEGHSEAHTPQSAYVDESGATVGAEPEKTAAPVSLARNPWLYVLWAIGVIGLAATAGALWWANSILYGVGNLEVESYATVATVQSLAPIGLSSGSLALVGALLLHGFSWMRKNQ
ncbi:hypothetical protein AB0O95_03655 [Rhodoglobus sp. NPDC076762]